MSNCLLTPTTNVGRDHVDPSVPQLIADLFSGLTVRVNVSVAILLF